MISSYFKNYCRNRLLVTILVEHDTYLRVELRIHDPHYKVRAAQKKVFQMTKIRRLAYFEIKDRTDTHQR